MENVSIAYTSSSEKRLVEEFNEEFTKTVLPVAIFVGVETAIGFFGNLLVLYVFLFRYHVCNFRYFVLCLAFTDIIGTLTAMPGEVLTQLKWYLYPAPLICKIKSFFNVFTVSAEAFCLLTIAIDRYRKVCEPFGWQIQLRVARLLCGVIFFLSLMLALPVAFLWGSRTLQKIYRNQTITVTLCEKDEEHAHTDHPSHYTTGVNIVLGILLAVMFILYIFVARRLILQNKLTLTSFRVNKASSSTRASSNATSSLSPDVGRARSKAELSDAGYSSEIDAKNKSHNNNYVSSDGGLTMDEEENSRTPRFEFTMTKREKMPSKSRSTKKSKRSENRLRKKTIIMFILTITFVVTTVCYLTLLSFIAKSDDVLQEMSDTSRALYFFFYKLYFINHVMNPFVYGFLDPHFRKVIKNIRYAIYKRLH